MRYPYYRFSYHRQGKDAFQQWFRHFVKLGIPCCIVKNLEGFALWRYGQEYVEKPFQPNSKPIRGEIVSRSINWPEELSPAQEEKNAA